MSSTPFGFQTVGRPHEARRPIDWGGEFSSRARLDSRIDPDQEAYLSLFRYTEALLRLVDNDGNLRTSGYDGVCTAAWVFFDIDRSDDLLQALQDARALVFLLSARYELDDDRTLIFFSGSKGFHVGLPTSLFGPIPSIEFPQVVRCFAQRLAALAGVTIDEGIYDKSRLFRAPNSRHPSTELYKRHLSRRELDSLSISQVLELAKRPAAFAIPSQPPVHAQATADWCEAVELAQQQRNAFTTRRRGEFPKPYHKTLDFIGQGAPEGERAQRLYAAARDLTECNCTPLSVFKLLQPPALKSGLGRAEIVRTIQRGIDKANRHG